MLQFLGQWQPVCVAVVCIVLNPCCICVPVPGSMALFTCYFAAYNKIAAASGGSSGKLTDTKVHFIA